MLNIILEGLANTLSLPNFLGICFGTVAGLIVGIIPGIGPMVGMVVLLPFTYSLPPDVAMSLLLGVYCGGFFGGGIPAVLMRTPGVPSSIMTSIDGFELTRKGEAQLALSASIVASFVGGFISVIALMILAPSLALIAKSFSSPEYFMIALFGLLVVIIMNKDRFFLAVILTALGLWFSTVGIDPGTLVPRFDFGLVQMQNGLQVAPMCLGFFGLGQSLLLLEKSILTAKTMNLTRRTLDFSKIRSVLKYKKTLIKSSLIGTFLGVIPGTGGFTAAFLSYYEARRSSSSPEEFGQGTPEGCVAAEAANNAATGGAMVPLLTLGIPGEPVAALLLGIFTINGIYPGPLLLSKEPVLVSTIYFSMLIINILAFAILVLFLKRFASIIKLPTTLLAVGVMGISLLGIYSMNLQAFEMGVAIVMGVIGYIMLRLDWPLVPWVLGLILGPILEERLRESLSLSLGSPSIFFTRPISLGMIIAVVLIIVGVIIVDMRKKGGVSK